MLSDESQQEILCLIARGDFMKRPVGCIPLSAMKMADPFFKFPQMGIGQIGELSSRRKEFADQQRGFHSVWFDLCQLPYTSFCR